MVAYAEGLTEEVKWDSWVLEDPFAEEIWSERAVAVESLEGGDSIVVIDRQESQHSPSTPVLYKVTKSQQVAWSLRSKLVSGSPFGIAVNEMFDNAYVIVSSTKAGGSESDVHVLRFSGISSNGNPETIQSRVKESLFYTVGTANGVTKLFGCAINSVNGDVYLTGGTSSSLYGNSQGKGDVIVARLAASGEVLTAIQFGTANDEFGRAIDVNEDATEIVLAVNRNLEDGGSEALMYRLDPTTLELNDGPRMLVNYGAKPLFTVNDIALGRPAADRSVTTFMTGKALVIPDRDVDMFVHIFAVLPNDYSEVPVYVDGMSNGKGMDQGVSIRVGSDGNAYCIGSTESVDGARQALLLVISPTGRILLLTGREDGSNMTQLERPTAVSLTEEDGRTAVRYVGYMKGLNGNRASFGFVKPASGAIKPFEGFGEVVEEAAAGNPEDNTITEENGESHVGLNKNTIIIIASTAVGALAVAGIVAMVVITYGSSRRRRTSAPQQQ
ncbi:hypothetical protein BWQ96_06860 [Gracilariopsis chorda]|uniref:Uncharacterized protein n=1 Tax=Gracilariopsis chorda TaxID=448386 RepID=A0A2V3IMQ2_9FLOR|nr:hypothetical protein BWQ96_06860 [Gracilariopsis chorda]|eukprot:PXF43365.1 hypothetical protein BWQ96_06860 [Gracilariopsis chorda]